MALSRPRRLALGIAVSLGILGCVELVVRSTVDEADLLFAWEHPDGMIRLLGDQVCPPKTQNSNSKGPTRTSGKGRPD